MYKLTVFCCLSAMTSKLASFVAMRTRIMDSASTTKFALFARVNFKSELSAANDQNKKDKKRRGFEFL